MIKKETLLWACIPLAAALLFRLVLLSSYHKEELVFGVNMALKHAEVARQLVDNGSFSINKERLNFVSAESRKTGRTILIDLEDVQVPQIGESEPYFGRMPGYPLLLAGFWKITGQKRFIYAQAFTAILDSAAAFLLFLIGFSLAGRSAGLIAGLLYAFWPPTALMSFTPGHDALSSAFNVLTLWLMLQTLDNARPERSRRAYLIGAGLTLGLSVIFRQDSLLLPFFMAPAIALSWGPRKAALSAAVMLGLIAAVVSPWVLRNWKVFGRPSLMPPTFWSTMLIGIGAGPNPWDIPGTDEGLIRFVHAKGNTFAYNSVDFNNVCKQETLKIIRENPFWYLKATLKKIPPSLTPTFLPVYPGPSEFSRDFGLPLKDYLKRFPGQAALHFGLKLLALFLWPLAALAFLLAPQRGKELALAASIIAYYWITHIPLHLEYRYLTPGHWPLFLLTAVTLANFSGKEAFSRLSLLGKKQ